MENLGQHATDIQHANLLERGNRLQRKIDAWCDIQHLYMPGVAAIRARVDKEGGGKALDATTIELLLPSHVIDRVECDMKLSDFEWRLRYAQAHDALDDIR